MVAGLQRELETLLDPEVGRVRAWESGEFDRLSEGRPIVLMGAGGLGRRALAGLRRHGVEPLAFADNGRAGTEVDRLRVLSPSDAAAQYGRRAAFVVTIWGANSPHRFAHSKEQLRGLGCDVVCPFPPLFWKHAPVLLPFYLQDLPSHLHERRADVLRAFDIWHDDRSREEYVAQVRFRALADFDGLSHPVSDPQYFVTDLFDWDEHEWLLDAGAYDGDTIAGLTALRGDQFGHVLALEPDPANFARLQSRVAALPERIRGRIECRQVAVSSSPGTLHLDATGSASSSADVTASAGTIPIAADTVDHLAGGARPTFLKFDIEGGELAALEGARQTIVSHAPVVAVCVYHTQSHLWEIPLFLRALRKDYALFLRPHNEEGWDLVCYAVPQHRLGTGRA